MENQNETCTHDCSSCPSHSSCSSQKTTPEDLRVPAHELSSVKHVIAVMSGKGGVGKSLVTSLSAVLLSKAGYRVGILDADITGPSIPKAFGVKETPKGDEEGVYPVASKNGIEVMSINLLLQNENEPVIWRGPILANVVQQFWQSTIWSDIDYLLVDLPPGTGDVPLTVMQSLPVDGVIVVTSPQSLVEMIVEKAVKMAEMMNIKILGVIENMSYFVCDECGKKHFIFGKDHLEKFLETYHLALLGKLPIDANLAQACDAGEVEKISLSVYEPLLQDLVKSLKTLEE